MKIHFLNVGHGDMTLIQTKEKNIMIDCCVSENKDLSNILKIFSNKIIDYFFITHLHDDHIRGLKKIIEAGFNIKQVFESGYRDENNNEDTYKYAVKFLKDKSALKLTASSYKINKDDDFSIYCYNSNNEKEEDIHYNSLVLKFEENGKSVLFTGDSNCEVWQNEIMPNFEDFIKSDILHASHHGSRTFFFCNGGDEKTIEPYEEHIKKITPLYTIISAKNNDEKQENWPPHEDAIELYKNYTEKELYITGEDGNITFELSDSCCNIFGYEQNIDKFKKIQGNYSHVYNSSNISNPFLNYVSDPIAYFNVEHKQDAPWEIIANNHIDIFATVEQNGKIRNYYSNSKALPKHLSIIFRAKTAINEPFDIKWQIVNTGEEAKAAGFEQLRGGFYNSTDPVKKTRKESTAYKGSQSVKAFAIDSNNCCIGQSEEFIVNIK